MKKKTYIRHTERYLIGDMKDIIMLGPDLKVKGGVSVMENFILNNPIIKANYNVTFCPTHRDSTKLMKFLIALKSLIRFVLLCTTKIRIIYIHMSYGASFFRKSGFILLSCLFNKKIIIHMHGSSFDRFYNKSGGIIKKYIGYIIGRADLLITLTDQWKLFYGKIAPVEKVHVIHNSVSVPDINHYDTKSKRIVFLGRLGERKGIYDLISIIPDIINQIENISFVLAGDGDVEKAQKMVKSMDLDPYVEIPGWIGPVEKAGILEQAAIFVLPSYAEGLPVSVLEAMSYGIPVIASDVGGLSEVIKNGYDGILINAGDRNALRESILSLLSDSELRRKISQNCFEKVKIQYSEDAFAHSFMDLIDSLEA